MGPGTGQHLLHGGGVGGDKVLDSQTPSDWGAIGKWSGLEHPAGVTEGLRLHWEGETRRLFCRTFVPQFLPWLIHIRWSFVQSGWRAWPLGNSWSSFRPGRPPHSW